MTGPTRARADRPLDGLQVVELASGISGPLACRRLADLGAVVTKFEDSEGDWLRSAEPAAPGGKASASFAALCHGKTLRRTDLSLPDSRRDLQHAVDAADVVVCDRNRSWLERVGVATALDRAEQGSSDQVWILLSAYGANGPLAEVPGSELTCQAAAGYTAYLGARDEPPSRLGANVGETATAIFATQAVLAARYAAAENGARGQVVTLSTLQSLLSMESIQLAAQAAPDDFLGLRVGGAFYPQQRGWRCADGRITFAFGGAVGKDGRPGWKQFITELGGEWMLDDPRFDHAGVHTTGLGVRVEETRADYEALFQHYSADFLVERVRSLGGSASKYQTLDEAIGHPQVEALGLLKSVPEPPGLVTRFPAWPPFPDDRPRHPTPLPTEDGAHDGN